MGVLLDTHALLRWLGDDAALGRRTRDLIADPGEAVLVSAASPRGIVATVRVGGLEADIGGVAGAVGRDGSTRLRVARHRARAPRGARRATGASGAPGPLDRPLIARAIAQDATLLSEDRRTALYRVRSLACSG